MEVLFRLSSSTPRFMALAHSSASFLLTGETLRSLALYRSGDSDSAGC